MPPFVCRVSKLIQPDRTPPWCVLIQEVLRMLLTPSLELLTFVAG
jgi:hypothetical protein